jgi:hypothetical protein
MVMYGMHNRLQEMHEVLDEMECLQLNRTKKTFLIMRKAYCNLGRNLEANAVGGLMLKLGVANPTYILELLL